LKDKPILNRRFIRLKAIQNLYAFYVGKQADYQWALDQIQEELAFDVFAEPPMDKQQQSAYQNQALSLFTYLVELNQTNDNQLHSYPMPIQAALQRARSHYEAEVGKDLKKLQSSWNVTMDKLQEGCLLILTLLIEWGHIAQQQAERIKLAKQSKPDWPSGLVHNRLLELLPTNQHFKQLIQQYRISWSNHIDLLVTWYHTFVKANPKLYPELTDPLTLVSEEQLLDDLVQKVIFEEKMIQDFFSDLDLSWVSHKPVVKKLVEQVLKNLVENKEKNTSLEFWGIASECEVATDFYDKLITHTLAQDQAFEEIIKQHIKNWSIERVVLLDKVIIKLALAEMIHITSIPIKVSMNEYIDLSKLYSTPKSSHFINGVLDAVAKTLQ
jgi:transcription antitermination protein NusB